MTTPLALLGIIFFSIVLMKSANVLASHLRKIATQTKVGGFFLTSLIIGLATSVPELFVGITSALDNVPNLSLGNALGSNIANVSLVAGGAALIGGTVHIRSKAYARDLLHSFLAGLAPLFLLLDNSLSRVDGLILLAIYGFYNYDILMKRMRDIDDQNENAIVALFRRFKNNHTQKHIMYVFLSIAVILFSSDMIVRIGKSLAEELQLPILLVGVFFIAVGTSIPEFVVSLQAIRKRDISLFLGDLLGSLVANGTLIIGVTTLIRPIQIQAFDDYVFATVFFLLLFLFFYFYVRTRRKLERWEGGALILLYFSFILVEFLR